MVRPRSALLCLVLAAAAPASAGEPKPAAVRAYERGARELEFGRFVDAAQAFAAAIALDPDESPQPVARPSMARPRKVTLSPPVTHSPLARRCCRKRRRRPVAMPPRVLPCLRHRRKAATCRHRVAC